MIVVIKEGYVRVIALDEAVAGGVILLGGKRESGVVGHGVHRLDEALDESIVAEDPAAVVILEGSGDDFGGGGGVPIDEDDDGVIAFGAAVAGDIGPLGEGSAAMGDDGLAGVEESTGYGDPFVE